MNDRGETVATTREELASLLAFYRESGLDFPVSDGASNHFEPPSESAEKTTAKPQADPSPAEPTTQTKPAAIPDSEAMNAARALAEAATTLDELAEAAANFGGCSLAATARHTVFEGGNRGADLMVLQAAPTREDDEQGAALSGASGRLLTAMLAAIDLEAASDCYFGFCVPWFPPGGADPTDRHLDICAAFHARQIALAKPRHLLLLGSLPARRLFGTKDSIMHMRGNFREAGGIPAIATHKPADLINEPGLKRVVWHDLLTLQDRLSADRD